MVALGHGTADRYDGRRGLLVGPSPRAGPSPAHGSESGAPVFVELISIGAGHASPASPCRRPQVTESGDIGPTAPPSAPSSRRPHRDQASGPAPGSGDLVPATPITPAGSVEADDQSDISSFASGNAPGTDEDMLSSLASDVKSVKKEQNVSLLRELKDFKAPATDIEKELSEISEQFNTAINSGAKMRPVSPG